MEVNKQASAVGVAATVLGMGALSVPLLAAYLGHAQSNVSKSFNKDKQFFNQRQKLMALIEAQSAIEAQNNELEEENKELMV